MVGLILSTILGVLPIVASLSSSETTSSLIAQELKLIKSEPVSKNDLHSLHERPFLDSIENKSNDLELVFIHVADSSKFPVFRFTLFNHSDSSIIITSLDLDLFYTGTIMYAVLPQSRRLLPIDAWEIQLPSEEGHYQYQPDAALLIAPLDAATIDVRIYSGSKRHAYFPPLYKIIRVRLAFVDSNDRRIHTPFIDY
jgi:hypothetical protein